MRFEGFDALLDHIRLGRFERAWQSRLQEQVPSLPSFDLVVRDIRRAWRQLR